MFTWGGSRIASNVLGPDDSAVKFTKERILSACHGERGPHNNATVPVKYRDHLQCRTAGVLLRNGDFIEGEFRSLKEDGWW